MKRPPVWLLVAVTATGSLALNIFVPSVPGLVTYFATDLATVQLAISLYLVGVAGGQLVYGSLSDRFGRRPVLLVGLVVYVFGGLACALAPAIEVLVAGRVLQALGACAGFVIGRAMVRDVYGRERAASALGYLTAAVSVVPAVAPAIGGTLEVWFGWRASFVLVVIVGVVVLMIAHAKAHETHFERQPEGWGDLLRSYVRLLSLPRFSGYAFNVALTSTAFFAFITGAPVIMANALHYPPDAYGWYFIGISGCYMIGNAVSGRFTMLIGLDRMAWSGTILALLSSTTLLALGLGTELGPILLFAPMWVVAFGNGLSQPNATAAGISADPRRVGAASGLLGALQMGCGAVGTALVGHFNDDTALPVATVMVASALAALLALAITRRSR
ncbi:MAG: multidrug effflux MFS transporter [Rhodospirillales bacterium]|nr:multidrug effflux MFS transporter [Rhodospirillales bacterium]